MRVHLVQLDIGWEDPDANFAQVEQMLSAAEVQRGDLVVLPEMFDTGFSLNADVTADSGRTLAFVRGLAQRLGVTVQGGRTAAGGRSAFQADASASPRGASPRSGDLPKATNRAPVFDCRGELLCEYRKIHPFSFGREPERFEGGGEVMTYAWGRSAFQADTGGAADSEPEAAPSPSGSEIENEGTEGSARSAALRICPAICYDLRFPELFRIGLTMGAEAFALGANWPQARQAHWRALAIARAIENQAFVFAVNRTGADPHLQYAGGSIVVGPKGDVLGELGDEEQVLSVEVDVELVRAWRREFPAWRDLRLTELRAGTPAR